MPKIQESGIGTAHCNMMNSQPLVSVLMTAYNREAYIAEAIESVLNSSYNNLELIVVDDVSSDGTVDIIKRFALADSRIRYYINQHNLGDYKNRNYAAGLAKGEFIIYVDSDDTILAEGVSNCVVAMLNFPTANVGMYWLHSKGEPFLLQPAESISRHFYEKAFLIIGPGGTILRRSFFEAIGKYPEKYGPANDLYFNLKIASATPLLLLPFEFINYRRHEGQQINNRYSYLINNYRYLQDALRELTLPLTEDQKRWLIKKSNRRFTMNIAKYFFKTFDLSKTLKAIRQAGISRKDAIEGIFHI